MAKPLHAEHVTQNRDFRVTGVLYPAPEPVREALVKLYAVRDELRNTYMGKHFSLDGNLIGDIGEIIAQNAFGLTPLPNGGRLHDFKTRDGRLVQVKASQRARASKQVGLGLKKVGYQHLLVIELHPNGEFEVLFNGPGEYIEPMRRNKASAGLSRIQLRKCHAAVPPGEVIPFV